MKAIGNVDIMNIDIQGNGGVNMKFNDKMNKLTLLTGTNGTGKSVLMKMIWALSYIANIYVAGGRKELQGISQFVFDNTIHEHKMDGTMRVGFDGGVVLTLGWKHGECIASGCDNTEDVTEISIPIHMSSGLRTFQAIDYYLSARRQFSGTQEQIMEQMLKHYKLYDVEFMERMIGKMPFAITEKFMDHLEKFDMHKDFIWPKGATSINLDKNKGFFVTNGVDITFLAQFGSGMQSILNMTISAFLTQQT